MVDVTVVVGRDEALTGTWSGQLTVWSFEDGDGRPSRQLEPCHSASVTCLAVSTDRRLLASTSADCTVKLWDLTTQQLRRTLLGHSDEVYNHVNV